jgi:hypothetical protein
LDEVVLKIGGVKHWLWRAVDQVGIVLDVLVKRRRNKYAAKRLLRKLLKRQMRPPRVMITDKLASYGAAKREIMPGIEHRQHKGLNNRAENSHQPTRRRERQISNSNRPVRRSASSQPRIRSITSSTFAAIASLPLSKELSGPNSRSGPKSVAWAGNKPECSLAVACNGLTRPDKLTVPDRLPALQDRLDQLRAQEGQANDSRDAERAAHHVVAAAGPGRRDSRPAGSVFDHPAQPSPK